MKATLEKINKEKRKKGLELKDTQSPPVTRLGCFNFDIHWVM